MKTRIHAAFLIPLVAAAACAPGATMDRAAMDAGRTADLMPAGTIVTVELARPLGATMMPLDGQFEMHVVTPIAGADGRIVIPAGTLVTGTVTGAEESRAGFPELLGVRFEELSLNGVEYPLEARLIAVDLALADDDASPAMPGPMIWGVRETMVRGSVISDPGEVLMENELGIRPHGVISLGLEGPLPAGARIAFELVDGIRSVPHS
jgi:hypothetical protein